MSSSARVDRQDNRTLPARMRSLCGSALRLWPRVSAERPTAAASDNPALFIDVSVLALSNAGTGIQRVVKALALDLVASPPAGFLVELVVADRRRGYSILPQGFVPGHDRLIEETLKPACPQAGDVFLGLDYAAHLVPRHSRQLQAWQRRGVSLAFFVYDLLPSTNPEWFSRKGAANHRKWLRLVLHRADGIICISHAVAAEISDRLRQLRRAHSPNPRVVRMGCDLPTDRPVSGLAKHEVELLDLMRRHDSILMVGTVEPRKGYDQALGAMELLWNAKAGAGNLGDRPMTPPILVIAGRPGWKTTLLQQKLRRHPLAGQRLFWIEGPGDAFLGALYASADVLLFASRGEGFGLPLIEAASHGCPALARDLPVIREVAPPGTRLFHAENPQELSAAIAGWFADFHDNARPSPPYHGPTWADCGDDLRRLVSERAWR